MIWWDTVVFLVLGDRGSQGLPKCPNKREGSFLVLSCSAPAQSWITDCTCRCWWMYHFGKINVKCCSTSLVAFYVAFVQMSVLSPICLFFHFITLILRRQRRTCMPCPALPHGRSCVTETSPRNSLPLNFFFLTGVEAFSYLQVSVL